MIAKFSSRFEFIFTSLVKNSPRLFTTVQAVMRAYESTKLYRELKLRGSIMKDGEVMLLPLEQVYNKYEYEYRVLMAYQTPHTLFTKQLTWSALSALVEDLEEPPCLLCVPAESRPCADSEQ